MSNKEGIPFHDATDRAIRRVQERRDLSHGTPLVKGGQGRRDSDTEAQAETAYVVWLLAVVLVFGLGLWLGLMWWGTP